MLAIFLMFLVFDDPPAVPPPPPVPPLVRSEEPAAPPPVRDRRAKWFAKRLASERQVRRPARPFARLRARLDARVLDRVPILLTMTPYERAKNTQLLFNQGLRRTVSRANLEPKWNVPGGLVGVKGWTSQLFKYVPGPVEEKISPIVVFNSHINRDLDGTLYRGRQTEYGWTRRYPNGTIFADVLSTDAGPFEVRLAEKDAGVWYRYVAWSNPHNAPAGYRRPTRRECAACHNENGKGSYNSGLAPSGKIGDTVISDPFKELQ